MHEFVTLGGTPVPNWRRDAVRPEAVLRSDHGPHAGTCEADASAYAESRRRARYARARAAAHTPHRMWRPGSDNDATRRAAAPRLERSSTPQVDGSPPLGRERNRQRRVARGASSADDAARRLRRAEHAHAGPCRVGQATRARSSNFWAPRRRVTREGVVTPRRSGCCDGVIESSRSPTRTGQWRHGECVVGSHSGTACWLEHRPSSLLRAPRRRCHLGPHNLGCRQGLKLVHLFAPLCRRLSASPRLPREAGDKRRGSVLRVRG